jgi:hypothetical protein
VTLFFIVQKLGVMIIFFLFEVGLNFIIKTHMILCFKNSMKKIDEFENFKFFSLLQINILM